MSREYATPATVVPAPFWASLPRIGLYPFRGVAAVTLGAVVVLTLLGDLPFVGILFTLLSSVLAYKYTLEIIRDTADGHLDPPEFGRDAESGTAIAFIVIQLVAIALILIAGHYGSFAAAVMTAAALALAMPAIWISLAMDGMPTVAINPATWLRIGARIGWVYPIAALALAITLATASFFSAFLKTLLPSIFGPMLGATVHAWSLFAAAHLLGWIILEYQDALGHTPRAHAGAPGELPQSRDQVILDQAKALLAEDQRVQARALLSEHLRERTASAEVHAQYRALLDRTQDRQTLLDHGRSWLHQLVEERDWRRAIALARTCFELDPAFTPLIADDFAILAERANDSGQSQLSMSIWRSLLGMSARDARHPDWSLSAARLALDRFGDVDAARTLLDTALAGAADEGQLARLRSAREKLAAL